MNVEETGLAGCVILRPNVIRDDRGAFVKTVNSDLYAELGLESGFVEEYYTVSNRGVLRGLHFQVPPMDHVKLVYCVEGRVLDAVLDIRLGSPTYGKHLMCELDAETANILYIPRGFAHGFYALTDNAKMVYKVSSVYSRDHDQGILWNSAGIPWPTTEVRTSLRDRGFPSFPEFVSPFHY